MEISAFTRSIRAIVVGVLAMLLATATAQSIEDLTNPAPEQWPTFSRTLDNHRYSPLDQIDRDNVNELRLNWSRNLDFSGSVQSDPVVWDGIMYINGIASVFALDATNGDLLWDYKYDLPESIRPFYASRMRGGVVVYDGKVFHNRNDASVVALDARTGAELWSTTVGDVGMWEAFTSGPTFADGKIIVGPTGGDGGGHAGRILALNPADGEILWTFSVVPGPGEPGFETWDPAPTPPFGGGVAWTPGAFDPVTGTIIYGTGNPTPWDRFERSGDNLYTASYVALDVNDGSLKWYHQIIPGDEWDLDQHVSPAIADLDIDGQSRRVAILPTTSGYLMVVDVDTGEFLRGHAMMPEGSYSVHLGFNADGTSIINEEARHSEPGESKLLCPFRWASYELGTFSPDTNLYYRPNTFQCTDLALWPVDPEWEPGQQVKAYEASNDPLADRFDRLGALSAINPVTGEVVWEYTHGYNQRAGAMSTAGGLVFADFPDRTIRAFDAETGEILWQQVLTTTMETSPMTYAVDGVQYIATLVGSPVAATGQLGLPPTVPGPAAVFVFALPEGMR